MNTLTTSSRTVRGKILRDTQAGPGLLAVDGSKIPFTLEEHWTGNTPPQTGGAVDIGFDELGQLRTVNPVGVGKEELEIAGELARQALGKGAPVLRASVQKIGTPVLVAMAIIAIGWIWLPAVTVQIMAGMAQSATMFDVLRMVNAGASLQDFGRDGSAGIYGLLCILAMAAPALPALWKHRLAPLGYFAPLAFLAAVALGIYVKMNAMASAASEQMRSFGGSQMGDVIGAMMKQVMQAVSVGFGAYVSLIAALYLAWIGLRAVRQS
ncbi:hypothetical protein ACSUZJ_02600 [Telluria sp. B2]|jgi:hypothetical protein